MRRTRGACLGLHNGTTSGVAPVTVVCCMVRVALHVAYNMEWQGWDSRRIAAVARAWR
jgi:hypothetical protein